MFRQQRTLVFVVVTCAVLCLCVNSVAGLYSDRDDVVILSKDNWAQEVLASPHVWLVEFYAPWCGHCKSLAPAWKKVATNLKGIVKVGVVDCDQHRDIAGMYGVKGFPTIKLFPAEQSKNPHQAGFPWKEPRDYQGARSAGAIAKFATASLPNHVVKLHKDPTFLEPKGDGDDVPHVLLFSSKTSVPTLYKAVATTFHGRMAFGMARESDTELAQRFGVTKFPTVLVLPTLDADPVVYDGPIKAQFLEAFLEPLAKPAPRFGSQQAPPAQDEGPKVDYSLRQVETQEQLDEWCLEKRGLCLWFFLDSMDDSKRFEAQKAVVQSVIDKHAKQAHIMWIDGPQQWDLFSALDLGGGFPNAAVYSPLKKRFIPYVGSFTLSSISDFLGRTFRGSVASTEIDSLPDVKKWVPPPPLEEFDDDDDAAEV